jgi:ubiquitin-like domain-containing CTD phosphatase 1
VDLPDDAEPVGLSDDPAMRAKLAKRVAAAKHVLLNEPRPGKKLLVADIDYTIYDLGSSAERPEELARPFLHQFFESVWRAYDIIIWSANSMKWVQVKMTELGVLNNPAYRVTALMCNLNMVTVGGHPKCSGMFDCKPLAYCWDTWPQHYSACNTVMIDDLRRNFVMNPQCGLKIKPFKRVHSTGAGDDELLHLARYFARISSLDDLRTLNHDEWRRWLADQERSLEL